MSVSDESKNRLPWIVTWLVGALTTVTFMLAAAQFSGLREEVRGLRDSLRGVELRQEATVADHAARITALERAVERLQGHTPR